MQYHGIIPGKFISRPNRFIANIEINGQVEVCHVKNTGRCKELLLPGAEVYVQEAENPNRKTRFDLIAVKKGDLLINIDSQVPNVVVEDWVLGGGFRSGVTQVRREVKFGNSRFDLYVEYDREDAPEGKQRVFMEVKGVTLENDGIACFPDAPTERGIKHVMELCECVKEGYEAYLVFVIQMKGMREMRPNWETHRAFGEALQIAADSGVHIVAYDCLVTPESIVLDQPVPVDLKE